MQILNNTTLPEASKAYFSFYHTRAFDPDLANYKITEADMTGILAELNLAQIKYPKKAARIENMKLYISFAIKTKLIENNKQNVLESLF
jgi:hypothetical protein